MLDPDRSDGVRLSVAEARALGEASLRRIGFPADEAAIITDQLIDNALCGYRFASLPRILAIAEDERTGKPRAPVRVVRETPVSALVDGGNKVGYVAAYRGAEIAISKALASGIAVVGVHNSYYSGRNAYYVELMVRAGLVGIHTASARPHVLPPGGRRAALGTNPISIGFPSTNGPVIYDIGTASLMWGEVLLMARLGQALPEGVGFDAEGGPTRNAGAVARDGSVTAFGGHKGYGLSFAIQALGLLAGAVGQDYGFLFIAIDPAILVADFAARMAELVARVKATPRQPGVGEIRIPSERAFREREQRRREGIVLDRKVVEALNAL
ncbi:MAG TPA: Ldh family oxidoreductase [Acetobacteraceae bacterium]|jgi:LDH2 family malate/lactate/ureidoglycolate dehydrogenase